MTQSEEAIERAKAVEARLVSASARIQRAAVAEDVRPGDPLHETQMAFAETTGALADLVGEMPAQMRALMTEFSAAFVVAEAAARETSKGLHAETLREVRRLAARFDPRQARRFDWLVAATAGGAIALALLAGLLVGLFLWRADVACIGGTLRVEPASGRAYCAVWLGRGG